MYFNGSWSPLRLLLISLGMALVIATPTWSQTTNRDIAVAAKVFNFLETSLSGNTPVYIIFDPNNAASSADADAILSAISSSPKAGKVTMEPQKVEIGNLGSVASPGIIFVAQGMAASHSDIHALAAQKKLISVSTDIDCVRSGQCVVGVASKPKVQIFVNESASRATDIVFKSAFLLMVETL